MAETTITTLGIILVFMCALAMFGVLMDQPDTYRISSQEYRFTWAGRIKQILAFVAVMAAFTSVFIVLVVIAAMCYMTLGPLGFMVVVLGLLSYAAIVKILIRIIFM